LNEISTRSKENNNLATEYNTIKSFLENQPQLGLVKNKLEAIF